MHFIGAGGRAKVEHKYELGYALSRDEAIRIGKTTLQNFPSPLTSTASLDNILMVSQFLGHEIESETGWQPLCVLATSAAGSIDWTRLISPDESVPGLQTYRHPPVPWHWRKLGRSGLLRSHSVLTRQSCTEDFLFATHDEASTRFSLLPNATGYHDGLMNIH